MALFEADMAQGTAAIATAGPTPTQGEAKAAPTATPTTKTKRRAAATAAAASAAPLGYPLLSVPSPQVGQKAAGVLLPRMTESFLSPRTRR